MIRALLRLLPPVLLVVSASWTLTACGGMADDPPPSVEAEPGQDVEGQEVTDPPASEAPPATKTDSIPLCAGEDEPMPGDCQTLVYSTHGYCNRWMPCHPEPEPTAAPTLTQDEPAQVQAAEVAPEVIEPAPLEAAPPQPLTFSIVGEDAYSSRFPEPNLHTSLDTALDRWSAATCRVLVALPEGGQHTVSWGDSTTIQAGRLGQTAGSWDAARIQAKKITKGATPIILAHELGHLLARSNDHAADGVYSDDPFSEGKDVITAADLTKVCASFDCACFQPEE